MNSKNIIALTDTCLCMKCLKNKATHIYQIQNRGYGSIFDSTYTKFQVCDDCDSEDFQVWVDEEPNGYYKSYKYENNIIKFINSLPLESQELFCNRFDSEGFMEAQDWIDYELGELSEVKCEDYGLATQEDIW